MSQAELQALLYGALSSGSDADQDGKASSARQSVDEADTALLIRSTPDEVIAHYDFRVRSMVQGR